MPKLSVRQQIEKNGLLLIAVMMVGIYWAFDYVSSGHYLTRTLIAVLVIVYGFFIQSLINSRKAALEERNRALRKKINRLNSKGFYENYGDIVRLEDEAKSIQSRIDALNLNLDIGHEDTRQKIENIERGFSVDIEVVCLEI